MGGKKSKFQQAVSSHKPRKQRHSAALATGPLKSKPKPKPKHKQQHRDADKPTIPFGPRHRILLIGEGDLSFAASLVKHHGCRRVTATVLEKNESELVEKYPHAAANIAAILEVNGDGTAQDNDGDGSDSAGSDVYQDDELLDSDDEEQDPTLLPTLPGTNRILYGIDATKLPPSVTRPPHDRIIFNFPHVGGKSTDVNRQVRYNQELLVSFFRRALPALTPSASSKSSPPTNSAAAAADAADPPAIVVTIFEGEPYTLWNIRDLARHAGGLQLQRSFRFRAAAYPGYHHARTLGVVRNKKGEQGGGWKGEERPARTYVFVRDGEVVEPVGNKKRRRDDSSDDEN